MVLATRKDYPVNSEMELNKRKGEFGAANRQNNVSMDDEISTERNYDCVLKLHDGVEVGPTLRHATRISI